MANNTNVSNEALSKANGATHEFKNKIQGADMNLEKMAHSAGESIGTMATEFADSTAEYVQTGRVYVKENPGKSLALAAATGLVFGSLLTLIARRK